MILKGFVSLGVLVFLALTFIGLMVVLYKNPSLIPTPTPIPMPTTTPTPTPQPLDVEEISIFWVREDITISSDKPVILHVSGMGNFVTVPHDVTIIEIDMSGFDNTVYIPQSANPEVRISGVKNEVVRY